MRTGIEFHFSCGTWNNAIRMALHIDYSRKHLCVGVCGCLSNEMCRQQMANGRYTSKHKYASGLRWLLNCDMFTYATYATSTNYNVASSCSYSIHSHNALPTVCKLGASHNISLYHQLSWIYLLLQHETVNSSHFMAALRFSCLNSKFHKYIDF